MNDNNPVPSRKPATPPAVPRILSEELFAGAREIIIQHQGLDYRLRLTSQNKLILNK